MTGKGSDGGQFAALPPGDQTAATRVVLWSDEFNGAGELQYYRNGANNAVQNGAGQLVITAKKESYGGRAYTSARLNNQFAANPVRFTYGRMEARMKVPYATGMFPAFWTMGNYTQYGWPGNGEIDVVETINNAINAHGTIHMPKTSGGEYGAGADHR